MNSGFKHSSSPRGTSAKAESGVKPPHSKFSPDVPSRVIHGLLLDELAAALRALGAPVFRAQQIWRWLYVQRVTAWDQMKNLPAELRARLAERFDLQAAAAREITGEPGAAQKILVGLTDGECVEEVLIPAAERRTVCVSSQVGCKFGCAFCASGQAGFRRNLSAGEIVGQVLLAATAYGNRPTHLVFMGVGEPLDNYDEVLRAIRIVNQPDGLGLGARRITLSTCGVIPGLRRLAGEGLQVELSVSLHAPDDALRARLLPVDRRYPLPELLATCRDYTVQTKRIITFEYTLIKNVNDAAGQADALARLLAPLSCRVNLIPLSPVAGFAGEPSLPETAKLFIRTLTRAGLNATLRDSQGLRLHAACGQLRIARL
ncbi:MAG: 23S rRNA (adenine(2503)-C(2))-methyltransferase RlmN [Kiritimatiellaeota bacterium]|nr:23S rRNA (adenine(2503)-C(2))-methyltransferase RlmN [Kiritimatiellota bacterium]